jgi:macrolide-specific efflux system membrane fusion protein
MSKTKWLGVSAVVLILAVGGYYFFGRGTKEQTPQFKTITVERGTIKNTILSTGTVQPENKVQIKPPIAGRVEQVLVREGQKVRKGQVMAWMSSTERAALLDAASAKGEEELKKWQELYRSTPILAPINGTVIQRNVESGQTFTTADAILVISDRLTVKAQIDETDIGQVKLKQKAQIVLDAYPESAITARVDQIAYDSTTTNNVTTYLVDVLPDETPDFMRSGMTANVTVEIQAKENVIWVPAEALQRQTGGVAILKPQQEASPLAVLVKTGFSDGKRTEVVSGLNEGDVILVPEFKLNEAAKAGANPFGPPTPPRRR